MPFLAESSASASGLDAAAFERLHAWLQAAGAQRRRQKASYGVHAVCRFPRTAHQQGESRRLLRGLLQGDGLMASLHKKIVSSHYPAGQGRCGQVARWCASKR
jgi:hypothetical protein